MIGILRRLTALVLVALVAVFITACDETTDAQRSQAVSLINSERTSRWRLPAISPSILLRSRF